MRLPPCEVPASEHLKDEVSGCVVGQDHSHQHLTALCTRFQNRFAKESERRRSPPGDCTTLLHLTSALSCDSAGEKFSILSTPAMLAELGMDASAAL